MGALYTRTRPRDAPQLVNVVIDLPAEWTILNQSPAISRNSRHIVFSGLARDGRRGILMRPLGSTAAHVMPYTADGSDPFWAPDGEAIGFFAEGKLKVLRIAGGPPRVVCDAPAANGGTFLSMEKVLFGPGQAGGIVEVDMLRGTLRDVTMLDGRSGDRQHLRPMALADGRHFVYLAQRRDGLAAMLAQVGGGRAVDLGSVQSHVLPTDSGHVLFVRDGALLARKLDVRAGRLLGDTTILAQGLTVPLPGRFFDGRFAASSEMLVYLDWTTNAPVETLLTIVDREGRRLATLGEPAGYFIPRFSPDGSRLAVARSEAGSPFRDIWVFDLTRGSRLRLTAADSDEVGVTWSSDGKWLMFSSDRRGERDIFKRLASGDGVDELVFESEISKSVNAWSPDGRFVVYDTGGRGLTSDLYILPLTERRPRLVNAAPGFQHLADISSDGRWIAYSSSESGRFEVIVESFPEKGGRWQVSLDGGRNPRWRRDGRELFFLSGEDVMAVDVLSTGAALEWGAPRRLFTAPGVRAGGLDVSHDGLRFVAAVTKTENPPQRLTTLLNWTTKLN